ncbi:ParB [Enterobacter hormaechei]|uniref:thermonuclease family protein n=1 Tax=Enterobacter hormaechei TaxID=158836 RepID=UPI0007919916|nr:thermonuclease family protein [Enterobacter hormaechei]SAE40886.1 ParB [Enterobacter hormaechei]
MDKLYRYIYLICCVFFLSCFQNIVNASVLQGKVVRVLDGDTIVVLQGQNPVKVRLSNIDAPEKKQSFGRWSSDQLKRLVAGQPVTVVFTHTDRYERVLGRVFNSSGKEANREQVLSGAAWVYVHYNTDIELPGLQLEAQKQKRGLWAENQPVPPWEWRHKHN